MKTFPDVEGRLSKNRRTSKLAPVRIVSYLLVWVSMVVGFAEARILRIEITRTESPTFAGMAFGQVGRYEKLVGRAYGEIDPEDARNGGIADIKLAPRNARGKVEYSTDLYILRPIDRTRGNRKIFFELNNRGNTNSFVLLNNSPAAVNDPSTAADAGNGFLMEQGYTIVLSGWDGTVPAGGGRQTMTVPVAKNADGSAVTGPALEEFVVDNGTTLTQPLSYPAATLETSQATLTVREHYDDPPVTIPADGWSFVDSRTVKLLPDGTRFQQGRLYELTYQATDPLVVGLGFAATRDLAAFLRQATADDTGTANPAGGGAQAVYSFCFSQPCRFMRDFVHLGFNEDEQGKRAFDGVLNWVGGASGGFFNYRFAQPGRTHRQRIGRWYPERVFPFANPVLTDPVSGKTDGRLRRCLATDTCPKIFEANSANEYWVKAGSLLHTDTNGADLADAPNVRNYFFSSYPHTSGIGLSGAGNCQLPRNPLVANAGLRALLVALDQWVTDVTAPPASRVPKRGDGTLVPSLPQAGMGFPNIPGVKYTGLMTTGDLFDFGAQFDQGILTILPPRLLGSPYPALVPKTDELGNDLAGVRMPDVAVPLATYTGWGLRAAQFGGDDLCDSAGAMIPLRTTEAERTAAGDPRPSLEELYGDHWGYVLRVARAALELYDDRLLLWDDVYQTVTRAATSDVLRPR